MTQLNLGEFVRDRTRRIGNGFLLLGFAFNKLYSSEWRLCRKTAELIGPVTPAPHLNSFFKNRDSETKQTVSVRELLFKRAVLK